MQKDDSDPMKFAIQVLIEGKNGRFRCGFLIVPDFVRSIMTYSIPRIVNVNTTLIKKKQIYVILYLNFLREHSHMTSDFWVGR